MPFTTYFIVKLLIEQPEMMFVLTGLLLSVEAMSTIDDWW
jgi:hypothetical protein